MQDFNFTKNQDADYEEFVRIRRGEEARASVAKIECDLLSPLVTGGDLKEHCRAARSLGLGALVVLPSAVKSCSAYLSGSAKTSLVAAIGYSHGGDTTDIKAAAVKRAVRDGADEVEVSAPLAHILDGNLSYFKRECKKLHRAAKLRAVRVTLDCSAMDEKTVFKCVNIAADAGVNCVRLNGADGALVARVKSAVKGKCLLKAEGADGASSFASLCVDGAYSVSCKNALQLATLILNKAK